MRLPSALTRRRELCVVYGNCQAEPLRALLEGSPSFSARFETEAIPAIPQLRDELLAGNEAPLVKLRDAVSRASLVVTQRVRDDYHGLPLGTDQVLSHAPRRHRTVTFPAAHHEGCFPYFGYVPTPDGVPYATPPLVEYHDLRIMAGAARGLSSEQTERLLATYDPPAGALRAISARADEAFAAGELGLDVQLAAELGTPGLRGRMFHTVDHPTLVLMCATAAGVHRALGLSWEDPSDPVDQLGWISAPIALHTIRALELDIEPRNEWVRRGVRLTPAELITPHLEFYRERPDLLESGLSFHADRLRELDLR